jgi:hypothetical protein
MSATKMPIKGVIHGNTIELETTPGLPEGQAVSVILESVAPKCASPADEKTPQQRVAELLAWADSHSHITAVADDSRESIYEGRGE